MVVWRGKALLLLCSSVRARKSSSSTRQLGFQAKSLWQRGQQGTSPVATRDTRLVQWQHSSTENRCKGGGKKARPSKVATPLGKQVRELSTSL